MSREPLPRIELCPFCSRPTRTHRPVMRVQRLMPLRAAELCAGYGGLALAIEQVFGAETDWFSEFEAAPSKILARHWPDVPNHGDMTKIDWAKVEPVDIISGGTPCQDLSHAGRRKGMTGRVVIPAGLMSCGCKWADHQADCEAASPQGNVPSRLSGLEAAGAIEELNELDRSFDGPPPERIQSHGTRSNLWVQMREAIATIKPTYVVWENVRGAYSAEANSSLEHCEGCMGDPTDRGTVLRALGRVLGDLSDLGYDCQWRGLRAADVGAPHGRFRVFVLATHRDGGRSGRRATLPGDGETPGADTPADGTSSGPDESRATREAETFEDTNVSVGSEWRFATPGSAQSRRAWADASGRSGALTVDAEREFGRAQEGQRSRPSQAQGSGASSELGGRSVQGPTNWGEYETAIRRWESTLGRRAPAPTEHTGRNGGHRLSARFAEWMMGVPDGWITDTPGVSRNEALKAAGNGVVPQQAIAALRDMLAVSADHRGPYR